MGFGASRDKHRPDGGAAHRARHDASQTVARATVFLDPSGRRWRIVCVLLALIFIPLLAGAFYAWPRLTKSPEVHGDIPPTLTSEEVGKHPPVVGEGPLVRVLKLDRTGKEVIGKDPFSGEKLTTLTPAERARAGKSAEYVIERYGYADNAKKTISLTFDDGPDPVYTPKLLNVLSAEHVPATFFVTGANVAKHPEIIAREAREGHAVANHSLTHTDLNVTGDARSRLEFVLTDRIIRAVTHRHAGYIRLPYEGQDVKSTQEMVDGLLRTQQYGFIMASNDFDTLDWEYTAHPRMGDIPLPKFNGQNITVLMHDGGGAGRQKTIDYVKNKLIPAARAAGYTFTTMPQVQPAIAAKSGPVAPTNWDRAALWVGKIFFAWPNHLVHVLFGFAVAAVVGVGAFSIILALVRRRRRPTYPANLPIQPVSVVLAAYNEEPVIARTLRNLAASRYPLIEIIVVDDGSADGTSAEVEQLVREDARIRLIRQDNTGKWAALNRGIAQAKGEIVVTLDADTVFTPDTIGNLVRQFAVDEDGRLGAVAGVVRVGNRERNFLTRWQALEYLTQIGVERAAHAQIRAIPIVPGACAAWRKTAIQQSGGYSNSTLAEDCDLSLSLQRVGWQVSQDDDAIAYTEAPEDVDALLAQRIRWTFGTLQSIVKHRDMVFRRRYGWLGMLILPWYALSIIVPILFLPFLAVMALVTAQSGGLGLVVLYFVAFMAVHFAMAAVGIKLMGERWHHLAMIPIYRLVYEPLRAYLLYTSLYLAVRGVRMGWNKLQRTGELDNAVLRREEAQQQTAEAETEASTGSPLETTEAAR